MNNLKFIAEVSSNHNQDIKRCEQFIETAKDDNQLKSRGYQEWGDIAVLRGRLEEAKGYYEKARDLGDPQGIAKLTLSEISNASPPNNELPLNPNTIFINPVNSLISIGEIFAHFGMYQRALGIYSMVLRMEPSNLTTLLNMATVNFKREKYNRAISILERILVIHPNHRNMLAHRLLLARSYVMKGDLGSGMKNVDIKMATKTMYLLMLKQSKYNIAQKILEIMIENKKNIKFAQIEFKKIKQLSKLGK